MEQAAIVGYALDIHADPRIGGLDPHQTKKIWGSYTLSRTTSTNYCGGISGTLMPNSKNNSHYNLFLFK